MKLQRFNIHAELTYVNEWLTKHNMPQVTRHDVPEMGYIAWDKGDPVAAVFLRRCEGGLGIIDSLISNPACQPQLRNLALDSLVDHILEQAKKSKIKFVIAYTRDESVLLRASRHGFEQSPYQVLAKNLMKSES